METRYVLTVTSVTTGQPEAENVDTCPDQIRENIREQERVRGSKKEQEGARRSVTYLQHQEGQTHGITCTFHYI